MSLQFITQKQFLEHCLQSEIEIDWNLFRLTPSWLIWSESSMLSGNEINATLLALWKGNCLLQQPLIHYIIITIPWFFLVIISVECFQFRDWWLEYVLPPGRRDVFCKKLLFPKKLFLVSGYMLFRWTKKIFCPMQFDCNVCEWFEEQWDCHCDIWENWYRIYLFPEVFFHHARQTEIHLRD